METIEDRRAAAERSEWQVAVLALAGFWALHLVYRLSLALIGVQAGDLADPALWVALSFGVVLSIALCATLKLFLRRGLAFGMFLTAALSLPTSLVYASAELALFFQLSPTVTRPSTTKRLPDGTVVTDRADGKVIYRQPKGNTATLDLPPLRQRLLAQVPQMVITNATGWYFFYFGLGALFVGLANADRLRRAERAVLDYQRLAQASQLRALRYQVNPHFLFNTLNALSSLIMTGRAEQAEAMILAMAGFFRSTLAVDPAADISLDEELALQQLYLTIEQGRFPDRLCVDIDVPRELGGLSVPALILQPLIENAVKHGVARTQAPVTVRIRAAVDGGRLLVLTVDNDLPPERAAVTPETGTGVGLVNVRERLAARHGDQASCASGIDEAGRFRVELRLPATVA